ncbi:MAG: FAD-dependent oxidoreductase [Clostridia bacterium]|nr:FAD-dependent oxidoreductase [Clostridia bacterium]
MYDIIIIGGGPAGLTAGLYARRANKSVLILEKATFGGQITFSPRVENIPGFASVTGYEFGEKMVEQVIEQGADVEPSEALEIIDGDIKTVVTDSGEYQCRAVIIATGAKHRLPGLENEEKFIGNGISFCAVCDGAFYEGKDTCVLGGGNSALQEALLLSEGCHRVYVVQNLDRLTGEGKLAELVYQKENIEVITSSVITQLLGDEELKGVIIKDGQGNERTLDIDGLFVAIGLVPQNERFSNVLKLDSLGYADTDEGCLSGYKGIFVAGDCRKKKIRQVATACSDGAVSALMACDYLDGR